MAKRGETAHAAAAVEKPSACPAPPPVSMRKITAQGSRLGALKALAAKLAECIDFPEDARTLPQLAKQYRDTIREIEELEGGGNEDDAIDALRARRAADGQAGAVRKGRPRKPML